MIPRGPFHLSPGWDSNIISLRSQKPLAHVQREVFNAYLTFDPKKYMLGYVVFKTFMIQVTADTSWFPLYFIFSAPCLTFFHPADTMFMGTRKQEPRLVGMAKLQPLAKSGPVKSLTSTGNMPVSVQRKV